MGKKGNSTAAGLHVLLRRVFTRLVALVLALGMVAGVSTPALARTSDDKTFLAFTSDVHNKSENVARNRLDAWIDTMCDKYGGKIDYMGFCGDMGDANVSEANFWSYSEQAMLVVDQKIQDGKIAQACYTTGNHEFNPGNFERTTSSLKSRYTVDAYAPSVPEGANYYLYCLGSRNNAQSSSGYTSDQVKALSDFLDGCGTDRPIFVMTHFPLHQAVGRSTANALSVIELLNKHAAQKKTIVLLWGHNHSQKDPNYDTIYTPETSLSYDGRNDASFNFYYLAAGCMSDSEYYGSESVKGKGLVAIIDDATDAITFTYYNASGATVATHTTEGTTPATKYTITWKDGDGNTLKTDQVDPGATPQYSGATPTKTATAQYSYSFNGTWSPSIVTATEDATYTAQFDQTVNQYSVSFVDENGTELLAAKAYDYGTPVASITQPDTPTKPADEENTYIFDGWDPALAPVTENVVYKATYKATKIDYYTVTWKNYDGTVLETDEKVLAGEMPTYDGATPTKPADETCTYEFDGWDPEVTVVTGDATYTALFAVAPLPTKVEWKRLSGSGRYATMQAIVQEGFDSCDEAVLVTGDNFPDALAASSLAGSLECPVVLTSGKALSNEARDELKRLGVRRVTIVGGEGSVSAAVAEELENVFRGDIKIERIAGDSRQGTSLEVLKAIAGDSKVNTVVVCSGIKKKDSKTGHETNFADALSIGPWCYLNAAPIVLTGNNGKLTNAQVATLRQLGVGRLVIVGGTSAVSDAVAEQLGFGEGEYERLAGSDRYATSAQVAQWELAHGMTVWRVSVATGASFPDALAGAALCGSRGSVLILAKNENSAGIKVIADNKDQVKAGYVLGGESSVSASLFSYLEDLTK